MDPNLLYTLKNKLDGFQVYWKQEVEDFAKVFFKPADQQREADKGLLHKHVDPAVGRFQHEPEERQAAVLALPRPTEEAGSTSASMTTTGEQAGDISGSSIPPAQEAA